MVCYVFHKTYSKLAQMRYKPLWYYLKIQINYQQSYILFYREEDTMFIIDSNKTIHITRGDIGSIFISATDDNNAVYNFRQGDIVRLLVFKKKAVNEIVLSKTIEATPNTTEVGINLTSEDTRIGDVINKPVDYWYEIELNPDTTPQTLIGYDEDGPKIFRLYPEGVKNNE